jgi:hypothetical protein
MTKTKEPWFSMFVFGFALGSCSGDWKTALIVGFIFYGLSIYLPTYDYIPEGMGAHGDHTSDQGF